MSNDAKPGTTPDRLYTSEIFKDPPASANLTETMGKEQGLELFGDPRPKTRRVRLSTVQKKFLGRCNDSMQMVNYQNHQISFPIVFPANSRAR